MTHRETRTPSNNYRITELHSSDPRRQRFFCEVMMQDGWERWESQNLGAAVEQVVQAARILNGITLTEENITIRPMPVARQEKQADTSGRTTKVLRDLVAKLDEISDSPQWKSLFTIAFIHGQEYTGPNFGEELKAAKEVLDLKAEETEEAPKNEVRTKWSWFRHLFGA